MIRLLNDRARSWGATVKEEPRGLKSAFGEIRRGEPAARPCHTIAHGHIGGLLVVLSAAAAGWAADQPQWGQRHTRNMVSDEKGLAESFDPKSGTHVKWSVPLGTQTYSTPVIAGGKVFIGTNNAKPRDPQHQGDCGVLMCFDERDGTFCWQLLVPKLGPSPYLDWPHTGLVSPCTVEGNRVYLVSNRNEVMCLDLQGLANGNDGPYQDEGRHIGINGGEPAPVNKTDADILWLFDLDRELGIHQHDAAHCSILLDGPFLYACTSNGVDDTHLRIVASEAPGLVVLDRVTGRLVAHDRERMAPRTIHCTWSSPAIGEVNGKKMVFFGGGDGICYAFEALRPPAASGPATDLKCLWRFDCDPAAPRENVHRYQDNRREGPSNISGMPVFDQNRVYVAAGGDLWHGKPQAWLKCIDATQSGDITKKGEVWSYPLRRFCMSTPAIRDGLLFITDCGRLVHCLDVATGKPYWTHETDDEIWSSPLVADGKVYVATRGGEFCVLAAAKEKRLIASIDLGEPTSSTPVAANGVLYVTTMTRLYAIGPAPERRAPHAASGPNADKKAGGRTAVRQNGLSASPCLAH